MACECGATHENMCYTEDANGHDVDWCDYTHGSGEWPHDDVAELIDSAEIVASETVTHTYKIVVEVRDTNSDALMGWYTYTNPFTIGRSPQEFRDIEDAYTIAAKIANQEGI